MATRMIKLILPFSDLLSRNNIILLKQKCTLHSFLGKKYGNLRGIHNLRKDTRLLTRPLLEQTVSSRFYQPSRNFFKWYRDARKKVILFVRKNESLEDHLLIYSGPNELVIRVTHALILIISVIPLFTLYQAVSEMLEGETFAKAETRTLKTNTDLIFCSIGSIAFMIMFRLFTNRYILRIYYIASKKAFSAVQIGMNPLAFRRVEIPAGGMTRVCEDEQDTASKVLKGLFKYEGRRYVMFETRFRYPIYYNILLGYAKPEDLEESEDEE